MVTLIKNKPVLLKVEHNTSKLSTDLAMEMGLIADKMSALPLIVGETSQDKRMLDHVLYMRYGMYALNPRTLIDIMINGNPPLVEAKQGGYAVYIDSELMKNRMRELRMTRGDLSNLLGTSRKALYAYEKGSAKCALTIALKLESILGIPIIKALNPFEWRYRERYSWASYNRMMRRVGDPLREMVELFNKMRLDSFFTRNAPFDFMLKDGGVDIIGNVLSRGDRSPSERHAVAKSVADIFGVRFLPVSFGVRADDFISFEELKSARTIDDLIDFCV